MLRAKLNLIIAAALLFWLMSGCAGAPPAGQSSTEPQPGQPEKPVINEFVLGAGDSFDMSVYRITDLNVSTKINPSGIVMLPLIGDVQAAGRSIFAFRDEVKERYSKYLVDPQVTISITSVQSRKVLVLGEVHTPGVYLLDTDLSLLEALGKAGGWTQDASKGSVVLVRYAAGKPAGKVYSVKELLADAAKNEHLQANDIVYVQTKSIVDIARFMSSINTILSPILTIESGILLWPQVSNALTGKTSSSTVAIPTR